MRLLPGRGQAGHGVVPPLRPAQYAAELPDHAVPHRRPVRFVHVPEVVDIRYDAGERLPAATSRLRAPLEAGGGTAPGGLPAPPPEAGGVWRAPHTPPPGRARGELQPRPRRRTAGVRQMGLPPADQED